RSAAVQRRPDRRDPGLPEAPADLTPREAVLGEAEPHAGAPPAPGHPGLETVHDEAAEEVVERDGEDEEPARPEHPPQLPQAGDRPGLVVLDDAEREHGVGDGATHRGETRVGARDREARIDLTREPARLLA